METGCTEEEIRVAFRQLALAVHPDKNRDPRAGEAFAKVQQVTKCTTFLLICYNFRYTWSQEPDGKIIPSRRSVDSPKNLRLQLIKRPSHIDKDQLHKCCTLIFTIL